MSISKVLNLMERLESLQYCTGNEDEKYFPYRRQKKGQFMDSTGIVFFATFRCIDVLMYDVLMY